MAKIRSEALLATDAWLYSFPVSTVLPNGANSELPVLAKEHGIFSEDGFTATPSRSVTAINGSNYGLIRNVVNEGSFTMNGTLVQLNADNLELSTGTKKDATTGGYHWDTNKTGGIRSFVLDYIDETNGKKVRLYIKEGEITEVGEMSIVDTGLFSFPITITAYPSLVDGKMGHVILWEDDYEPIVTP